MAADPHASAREHARTLLTRVSEEFLRSETRSAVGDRAWRAFSAENQRNSVVLVGEVKRGKSALANALVGKRDASPSGSAIATAIPVVLGPETDDVPAGKAMLMTGTGAHVVDAADVSSWVTPHGTGDMANSDADIAARVYIGVADSKMGDAEVIDTPGVGGIEGETELVSANTARSASVIVVVADASAPLTAPEMNFIASAVARTESVIVAVTKIDKHLTRWRDIVAEDRRLLDQHTGRNIPVIGVSSLLPHLDQPQMDVFSGIPELRALIGARFANAANIPAANALRIAVEGLRGIERDLGTRVASLSESSQTLPSLAADLERLEALEDDNEQWKQYLEWDIAQAKLDAMHELEDALRAVQEKWDLQISTSGIRVLREEPKYYTQLMGKDFQAAADQAIAAFVEKLETGIIADRFDSPEERRAAIEEVQRQVSDEALRTTDKIVSRREILDRGAIVSGVSEGTTFSGAIAGLLSFTGAGAIAGIGWTAVSLGFNALQRGKSALLQWLEETSKTTTDHVRRALETAELSARTAITLYYRTYLKTQIKQTKERIEDAERAHALDQTQREQELAAITFRREEVRAAAAELEAHIVELMKGAE